MKYPVETWEWYGAAGHLIVGKYCRFHMATIVGPWLISTVGEYVHPRNSGGSETTEAEWLRENWPGEDVGHGRKYETMVFRVDLNKRCESETCGCGMPRVADWEELDFSGYNTAGEATRGHMAMCFRWASMTEQTNARL